MGNVVVGVLLEAVIGGVEARKPTAITSNEEPLHIRK
jgi:hypothetical protein